MNAHGLSRSPTEAECVPTCGQTLEVTDIHSKLLLLKRNKKERKIFLSYPKERVDADIAVL